MTLGWLRHFASEALADGLGVIEGAVTLATTANPELAYGSFLEGKEEGKAVVDLVLRDPYNSDGFLKGHEDDPRRHVSQPTNAKLHVIHAPPVTNHPEPTDVKDASFYITNEKMRRIAKVVYDPVGTVDNWVRERSLFGGSLVVFTNTHVPDVVVVANRGTQNINDVLTDSKLFGQGKLGDRLTHTVSLIRELRNRYMYIINVGHSLGGSIALLASYITNTYSFAYAPHINNRISYDRFKYTGKMHIYANQRDPVSAETLLDKLTRPGSKSAHWEIANVTVGGIVSDIYHTVWEGSGLSRLAGHSI